MLEAFVSYPVWLPTPKYAAFRNQAFRQSIVSFDMSLKRPEVTVTSLPECVCVFLEDILWYLMRAWVENSLIFQ